jgi:L-fuconolactonase
VYSGWPVCTLSGGYEATMGIVTDYLRQFTTEERDGVLGGNCARIYKIESSNPAASGRGNAI